MQKKARKLCRLDSTAINTPVGVMMAPTPKLPPELTADELEEQRLAAMRAHKVSPAHPSRIGRTARSVLGLEFVQPPKSARNVRLLEEAVWVKPGFFRTMQSKVPSRYLPTPDTGGSRQSLW
jgi:hypothetical protein